MVSECPEDPHCDYSSSTTTLRVALRIKCHEPGHSSRVTYCEARRRALTLGADDGQLARCWSGRCQRPFFSFFDAERSRENTICKPTGIRHLVDGVHISSADAGRESRMSELVQRQVIKEVDRPRSNPRRVL